MSKKEAKIWPRWHVLISGEDGKVAFYDRPNWESFKHNFWGKEMDIILKNRVKDRSRQEEKYYWAVVVRCVADEMGIGREEAHRLMSELFLKIEEKTESGIRYTRVMSTTELGDKRYDEYIFKECVPWAARPTEDGGLSEGSGLGLYLPLPNEVDYENA